MWCGGASTLARVGGLEERRSREGRALGLRLRGGATDIEIEAYLGTDKAYWDRERPSYASFESSEDGGLRLSIVDIFTDEEAYGHTFQ